MSRVRFATAQAVFETFPEVVHKISTAPGNQPPVEFLKGLAADGKIADAVTFCAYLLPRREAVWWACGCVRMLMLSGDLAKGQAAGLLAAEAWVYKPDDEHRQAALETGIKGDGKDAVTWLARAAGWSSGFRSNSQKDPIPPYMTARAVRIAVLFSAAKIGGAERLERMRTCIAEGIKLAENGL